jgi:MFS family permease
MRKSFIQGASHTSNHDSPQIFKDLQLGGTTTSLLATGVAGIFEFVFTIPAVLWVDNIGRKKILIAGGIGMAVCHFIVAGIIGSFQHTFDTHKGAGWAAVVFIWIFIINFAYAWGKPEHTSPSDRILITPQVPSHGSSCPRSSL